MKDKHWTLIGGSYIVFAIAIATLATHQTSHTSITGQPQDLASTTENPVWRSQQLDLADARADRSQYWITVWTTRSCIACEKQKALVPEIEESGYHVIIRQVPGQRWIKSFPAIVITKDKPGGDILHTLYGVHTTSMLDAALSIGEAEEEEDIDYDIFRPKAQVNTFNLIVWLTDNEESNRQYDEIAKLRKLGFSANVYVVGGPKRPPRHIVNFPTVILIDNSHRGGIYVWPHFVSATTIQHTANKRT